VIGAVLALPARYREVIVLCDFRELSNAEAALGRTMTARPASCPTLSVIRTSEDKQTGGRNPGHPEF
jgi:hypothetical protein